MRISGVYAIQHLDSGRTYIGSSVSIRRRWVEHRSHLNRGTHPCMALQEAWVDDGEGAFAFVIVAQVEGRHLLMAAEQLHLDQLDSPYNTNGRAGSGPAEGFMHDESTKRLISERTKGKKRSPETCARIAASRRGMTLSEAHKAAIGAAQVGRKRSAETRAKMSISRRNRGVCTWGAAISAGKRGKPWSDARRASYERTLAAQLVEP